VSDLSVRLGLTSLTFSAFIFAAVETFQERKLPSILSNGNLFVMLKILWQCSFGATGVVGFEFYDRV